MGPAWADVPLWRPCSLMCSLQELKKCVCGGSAQWYHPSCRSRKVCSTIFAFFQLLPLYLQSPARAAIDHGCGAGEGILSAEQDFFNSYAFYLSSSKPRTVSKIRTYTAEALKTKYKDSLVFLKKKKTHELKSVLKAPEQRCSECLLLFFSDARVPTGCSAARRSSKAEFASA